MSEELNQLRVHKKLLVGALKDLIGPAEICAGPAPTGKDIDDFWKAHLIAVETLARIGEL